MALFHFQTHHMIKQLQLLIMIKWASTQENLSSEVCKTQRRSLISAFVIYLLGSIISRLTTSEISTFKLVSVAEQAGLNLTLSDTLKTGLVVTRPKYHLLYHLLVHVTLLADTAKQYGLRLIHLEFYTVCLHAKISH